MIDGHGDPGVSPAFRAAIQALFGVSYALKFALRRSGGPSYSVAPLEGLWSVEEMAAFGVADKSDWDWTMMIRQPAEVTPELVEQAAPGTTRSTSAILAAPPRSG